MASDIASINRVRYCALDFDATVDDLISQLQIKFSSSFNDFAVSSLGIVLIDLVAYGLDNLEFYLDRRATDTYLATARTQGAVALLTRQLGYKMAGAVASSVDLQVATPNGYAFAVPIPQKFQFKGPGGTIFEAAQTVTIPANSNSTVPVTVPCYQGQTITETFISDGTPNQIFQLSRVPANWMIVQGSVTCTVNSASFEEQDFLTFDTTDQFEVGYNDTPPTIRFGDGVAGNIPVLNGSIVVTYIATLGASGEVQSGSITSVVTPLVVNFTSITLSITNPSSSVGGSDLEDLDRAKTYAPLVFKSRQVAVTAGDYQALAGSYADPLFGRVAVAEAISSRTSSTDIELQNLLNDISNNLTTATLAIQDAIGFNTWAASTTYEIGQYIVPTANTAASAGGGYYYQAMASGTSGSKQPSFPIVVGEEVTDGTVVWSCQGAVELPNCYNAAQTLSAASTAASKDLTSIITNLNSVSSTENQTLTTGYSMGLDTTQLLAITNTTEPAQITSAQATLTALSNFICSIPGSTTGRSSLTAEDELTLLYYTTAVPPSTWGYVTLYDCLSNISSLTTQAGTLAAGLSTSASSIVSNAKSNSSTLVNTIGLVATVISPEPTTLISDLSTQLTAISSAVGLASGPTGLYLALSDILAASTLNQVNIVEDCEAIAVHVNGFLAADCQANLVSVPILAVDASGFYAAPSIGLVNSLQSYLDGIKEVTQTVVVASGVGFLVPACITLRIGVDPGYSLSVVQATAQTIVNGLLMGRPFGLSLYLSDITEPLDAIAGVHFVNATITGYRPVGNPSIYSDLNDANGNLIIAANQVVTLSTADLAINVELYTGVQYQGR